MSLSTLMNRPVIVTRRSASGTVDDYGNDIPVETTVQTVCELQKQVRRASEEPDTQGELSDTLWLLILPAATDIRTGDVAEVDGEEYEMVGDPWPARNPRTGVESHVEATVRRTAGAGDGA